MIYLYVRWLKKLYCRNDSYFNSAIKLFSLPSMYLPTLIISLTDIYNIEMLLKYRYDFLRSLAVHVRTPNAVNTVNTYSVVEKLTWELPGFVLFRVNWYVFGISVECIMVKNGRIDTLCAYTGSNIILLIYRRP